RNPAQGGHAELERDRRDQQGRERAHLRVQRLRRRRRPQPGRAEADRARACTEGRLVSIPARSPPPWSVEEALGVPTDADPIEVGILVVGAGPAGLACAIRLGQLAEEDPETAERLGEVPVAVLEKGKQPGSHLLSGAVVNPRGLPRLFKGRLRMDAPPSY